MSYTRSLLPIASIILATAAFAQVPNDSTSPRIATNLETKDLQTRLDLMQQDLYQAQQEIMFLNLVHNFEDNFRVRRVMFPSGKEIVPGYVFSPRKLDAGKKYPGLVIVHGGFHSRLDWHFFDL